MIADLSSALDLGANAAKVLQGKGDGGGGGRECAGGGGWTGNMRVEGECTRI